MEVFDVGVFGCEPVPLLFFFRFLVANVTFVGTNHELELVVIEVNLDEDSDYLIVELSVDVFSDSVEVGKFTSLNPLLGFEVVVVANSSFVTTDKEDISKLVAAGVLNKGDTRSTKFSFRFSKLLNTEDSASLLINVDDKTITDEDRLSHWNN